MAGTLNTKQQTIITWKTELPKVGSKLYSETFSTQNHKFKILMEWTLLKPDIKDIGLFFFPIMDKSKENNIFLKKLSFQLIHNTDPNKTLHMGNIIKTSNIDFLKLGFNKECRDFGIPLIINEYQLKQFTLEDKVTWVVTIEEETNVKAIKIEEECVVCFEDIQLLTFNPCGHTVCCYDCYKIESMKQICPMCRKDIRSFYRIKIKETI